MTTLKITVPTNKAGQQATFNVEFSAAKLSEVLEHVELLTKPSDVQLCEEMGIWKIK